MGSWLKGLILGEIGVLRRKEEAYERQKSGRLYSNVRGAGRAAVSGLSASRYWFVEGVDGPWEWRMELARRGIVASGKLFSKKAGLVSREWYPDLANYRRDGYDFDAQYEEGLASYREKCVMDVLLREGPTLSKDLKRLAGFGGDGLRG